jgi:GNAT superfamily N-acetyltransferase
MKVSGRSFRSNDDLFMIGALIRRAYLQAPRWNAWSFARFDIWAQRRIAGVSVHGEQGWRQDIRLWETGGGRLVGAILFDSDHGAALIVDPDQRQITEAMLDWVEARSDGKRTTDRPLSIEAMESNAFQEELLRSRNYVKTSGHYIHREKPLDNARVEPVALPQGFVIKPMETLEEMQRFHLAVKAVFGFEDSVEVYQIVQQAPSYVPELDLIIVSEGSEVAAFCTAWLDGESGVAELEPVGTVPDHRKKGLGAALVAEASNRLRFLDCRKVTVNSWSESVGANRLYEAAGLQAEAKILGWEKP